MLERPIARRLLHHVDEINTALGENVDLAAPFHGRTSMQLYRAVVDGEREEILQFLADRQRRALLAQLSNEVFTDFLIVKIRSVPKK